jgi:hypothetical protein
VAIATILIVREPPGQKVGFLLLLLLLLAFDRNYTVLTVFAP